MGGADWGGGFATGVAAGRAGANPQYQHSVDYSGAYYDERNARRATEQNLLSHYSNREGVRAQRNALLKALSELAPDHPLVSPVNVNGRLGSPLLDKIFIDAIDLKFSTALGTDQELRAMCPLLAAEFDENQKKLAEERKKQEEARMKALEKEYLSEMKASGGGGMFSRLLGSRPTGFPEFKDWLVQKGYVKPAGQDQANGVEQKG